MGPETGPLRNAEALLTDATSTPVELAALWRGHEESAWRQEPHLYAELARRFMAAGDPLLAHEVLTEARQATTGPRDPRLEHLYGLALARSGATERAAAVARELRHRVRHDPELYADVMGLLGRTEKDHALHTEDGRERRRHLRRALAIYRGAFRRTQKGYNAINAATLALLLDREQEARDLAAAAARAVERERKEQAATGGSGYWPEATMGEAALIHDDHAAARRHYATAARAAAGQLSDLSSMRRQARLILAHKGLADDWLDPVFGIPRVGVFVAQTIRALDRPAGGDAASYERELASRLASKLDALEIGFGYASAAAGAEILFLEAVQARGGQTTVVLPCAPERFVDAVVPPPWRRRFERVVERSVEVVEASRSIAGPVVVDYAALLLMGLARIQGQVLDTHVVSLAVWDGAEAAGAPAAAIRMWRAHGHEVDVMHPDARVEHV